MWPNRQLSLCGIAFVCSALAPIVASAQTIFYVDRDATGPLHDGTAWCTAYTELHQALDVASANTVIRVADGVYRPDRAGLPDMRTAAFSLIDGVTVEGGYAGCDAADPDVRDTLLYESTLSGDLFNNDGNVAWLDEFAACYTGGSTALLPGCQGFDFNFNNSVDGIDFATLLLAIDYDENSYHVVTSSSNAASASLDGLTISGGAATGTGANQNNGGGMYAVIGAPSVTNCTFRYNVAENGGGIFNDLNAQTLLVDCAFTSNFAYSGASAGFGGGALNFNGHPVFRRCQFWKNASASGGGVFGQNSSATIEACRFVGNRAVTGAGLYSSSANTSVLDALFSGNIATVQGGGMRLLGGSPTAVNGSVSQNDALIGGGIASSSASLVLENMILWNNTDGGGTSESAQLDVTTGSASVFDTCIQGLNQYAGNGNIGADPVFLNPSGADGLAGTPDDDLRLPPGSPCVDAGDNDAVSTSIDLDGNARILDGDGDGTSTVDMGAYELDFIPPPVCFGVRDLSVPQLGYDPGVTKTVRIELFPGVETTALGIEDTPPPGWTSITNISNGGSYDALAEKVKWEPLFAPFPAEITYDITPPVTADQQVCFDGVTSENGDRNETTCGDQCIEAFSCPFLPADDPQPACPGCADCMCGTCQDGQIVLCEMVGYVCAWKAGCNDNLAAMTRAAFLWQSGEFFCWDSSLDTWMPEPASPTNPGCCTPSPPAGGAASATDVGHRIFGNSAVMRIDDEHPIGRAQQIQARITINAAPDTVAVGLEIQVPDEWTVTEISDDGSWDAVNRKVKWGPIFEALSRNVGFGAISESGIGSLDEFSGTVSFDGYNEPVVVLLVRNL